VAVCFPHQPLTLRGRHRPLRSTPNLPTDFLIAKLCECGERLFIRPRSTSLLCSARRHFSVSSSCLRQTPLSTSLFWILLRETPPSQVLPGCAAWLICSYPSLPPAPSYADHRSLLEALATGSVMLFPSLLRVSSACASFILGRNSPESSTHCLPPSGCDPLLPLLV